MATAYNENCDVCMIRKRDNKEAQAVLNAWEYSFWLSVKDNADNLSRKQEAKYLTIKEKLDINDEIGLCNFRIGKLNTRLAALMGES